MGHRTGIGTIFNNTSVVWRVNHPETGRSRTIPAGSNRTFNCDDIFGWVIDDTQLAARALQFRTAADGVLRFVMFENYSTNEIQFASMPGATFLGATSTGVIAVGCAGVTIVPSGASGTPSAFKVY